jgi:predicted kinase
MRTLLLLRGAPGCGKSTFIDTNNLRPFALSADELRVKCTAPIQNIYGDNEISPKYDKYVWETLFNLLEIRMKHGDFTVIDATNSKTSEMKRYKELASKYRYRIFCVDFTDLPIEECKRRNSSRVVYKRVPEEAIDKMYARFASQGIPSGVTVIKPNELDKIFIKQFDFSEYEKVIHIGDIHGCYTALSEYFKNGLNDKYMYIFTGDYLDRGVENAETLKFVMNLSKEPNVLFLEGNHEIHLWNYANDIKSVSEEFENVTKPELISANISKKDIRTFYRKLGQCAWYTYRGKEVFVCHGGIAKPIENMTLMATQQMIRGVGGYKDYDKVADTWMNATTSNQYQIFGHRNTQNSPTQLRDRVFNLEGKVEFGGYLRIVELSDEGFNIVEIKNDVYKSPEMIASDINIIDTSISNVVERLRNNKFIQEKSFGNISSFNFTKSAFNKGIWDAQTITARGLYIDTQNMKIVCRGYNKFFNINETDETKFDRLQNTLKFPVTCYVKENGFLALVSYNQITDDLFITTKSNPDGEYAKWLRDMIYDKMSTEAIEKMKNICKTHDVTLVFECVDMKNDPHIIEYDDNKLFLLSIIKNDIKFAQWEYSQVVNVGAELNIQVKEKAFEIADWEDFCKWYEDVTERDYEYNNRNIEGFVIEDANGYMVKLKLWFYKRWKFLRGVAHETLRSGGYGKTSLLMDKESNEFYGFCRRIFNETTKEERLNMQKDIITLRNRFFASR